MFLIKKMLFIFILFLSFSAFAHATLSEKITKAEEGAFYVSQQGKMASVLIFKEIKGNILLLEEISFPCDLAKTIDNYHSWVEDFAPGNTSWIIYEIDLQNQELLEAYSFSRDAYLHFHEEDNFLSVLLGLQLYPVPLEKRRRIGPPPPSGSSDYRALWNPPVTVNGKKVKGNFSVFHTLWPKDESLLSNKRLELYFDENHPLPFWIQVYSGHGSVFSKMIDSGKKMKTPYSLPKRYPRFADHVHITKTALQVKASIPKYFQDFDLCAVDDTQKSIPLKFTYQKLEKELFLLNIDAQNLEKNKNYFLFLFPKANPEFFAQSAHSFTY